MKTASSEEASSPGATGCVSNGGLRVLRYLNDAPFSYQPCSLVAFPEWNKVRLDLIGFLSAICF